MNDRRHTESRISIRRIVAGGVVVNLATNALLYLGHVLIARGLSRDDYAAFSVAISFVSLMALFADLGLTLLFVRKFAEADEAKRQGQSERRGELLGSMLVLRIGLAIIVSAVVVVVAPLLGYPPGETKLMHIMLLALFISSRLMVVRSVGEAFLRGHNQYHYVALFAMIDSVVFAGALYILHGQALDLDSAVWIYTLCQIPGAILLTIFIMRHARELRFRLSLHFGILKEMVVDGFPLILSTAFLTIHNFADTLLLDKLSTPMQVSAFAASLRVLAAIVFLPVVFSAVIGPHVTKAMVRNDARQMQRAVNLALRVLLITAVLVALSLTCLSTTVMHVLFGGDKYVDASSAVTIFGWTFVPIAFATFLTEIAVAEGKLWISTVYMAVIMVVSVSVDLLLIPHYGALGAATAKCIAVSVGSLVLLGISRQLHVLELRSFLIFVVKAFTAVAISLGAIELLASGAGLGEFATFAIVVSVFFVSLLMLRGITRNEISLFISTIRPGA